jgi:hypothetical protein
LIASAVVNFRTAKSPKTPNYENKKILVASLRRMAFFGVLAVKLKCTKAFAKARCP